MWSVSERSWSKLYCLYCGVNSIACTVCKQWVHKRCSGISGSLNAIDDFECQRCVDGIMHGESRKEMEIENVGKLECVEKFCYMGNMIGAGGGAEEASRARVQCAWSKFRHKRCILKGEWETVQCMCPVCYDLW